LNSPQKNIVYIVSSLNLGGTENLVVQMSQTFQSTYNISVICLDEPGLWAKKLRNCGIPVYCFWRQPGLDLSMAVKIAVFCKKKGIDIIHAHQCTPWFYSALSRLFQPKTKLLFEEHGRHYPEHYHWGKNCLNKILIQNLTHKAVAVSRDVAKRLVKYEGMSKGRIDVVYNGVHFPQEITAERRKLFRKQFGFKANDFIIGAIGRLDPIKNLPLLINAIFEAKNDNKDIKGLLVGDGPELEKLKNQVAKLNLKDDIFFTGYRKDATEILQCMDIFSLCSFSEGTSMALLEAMATGIPAIVTNVGGNPELIAEGVNGWIIQSDNLIEMTAAIIDSTHNIQKRKLYGKEGQKRYMKNFTFDIMVEKYKKIYLTILTNGSS
jgi:L-malate glycosyltransferase